MTQKDRDSQYEVRVNGQTFFTGDAYSIGVLTGNLTGANFRKDTHADWLVYMEAEYKTPLPLGANVEMRSPEGKILSEGLIGGQLTDVPK